MGLSSVLSTSSSFPVISPPTSNRLSLPPVSCFHLQCSHRRWHAFSSTRQDFRKSVTKIGNCSVQTVPPPPPPIPSGSSSGCFGKGWIAGIVLTLILPFMKSKWGPLLLFKQKVDTVMQTMEDTAEALEKAAEELEKVADDISEKLPEGKLKNAAALVERVAKEAAHTAHLADATIDKIQELEEEYIKLTLKKSSKTNDEARNNHKQA